MQAHSDGRALLTTLKGLIGAAKEAGNGARANALKDYRRLIRLNQRIERIDEEIATLDSAEHAQRIESLKRERVRRGHEIAYLDSKIEAAKADGVEVYQDFPTLSAPAPAEE